MQFDPVEAKCVRSTLITRHGAGGYQDDHRRTVGGDPDRFEPLFFFGRGRGAVLWLFSAKS